MIAHERLDGIEVHVGKVVGNALDGRQRRSTTGKRGDALGDVDARSVQVGSDVARRGDEALEVPAIAGSMLRMSSALVPRA